MSYDKGFPPKITAKGTELPLMNLKGKPYLQVAHRLVWFREDHPHATIVTNAERLSDTDAVFRAAIMLTDDAGRQVTLATAHKSENVDSFSDFIEKAETGAIGRALAMAGYGTQFDPELDEGDRLADSPIAVPTKGVSGGKTVQRQSKTGKGDTSGAVTNTPEGVFGSTEGGSGKTDTAGFAAGSKEKAETSRADTNMLINSTSLVLLAQKKLTKPELIDYMKTKYNADNKEALTDTQATEFLAYLQGLVTKAA